VQLRTGTAKWTLGFGLRFLITATKRNTASIRHPISLTRVELRDTSRGERGIQGHRSVQTVVRYGRSRFSCALYLPTQPRKAQCDLGTHPQTIKRIIGTDQSRAFSIRDNRLVVSEQYLEGGKHVHTQRVLIREAKSH
jgi:hypothetical protein